LSLVRFVLDYWFLTPVSIVAATIATMVGIGGPVFFTPLFIFVLELPPATAVATALFTQSFGFLSGAIAYWRSHLVDRTHAGHLLLFTVPAALAGSLLADKVPAPLLRRLFGCVALAISYQMYVSAQQDRRRDPEDLALGGSPHTVLVDRSGATYRYTIGRRAEGAVLSTVGAVLLGMISVGLAELQGYQLIARGRVPPPVAVATTVLVVLAAVVAASAGHLYNLTVGGGADELQRVLQILLFTVPGVLIGGQLGPLVQTRLNPRVTSTAIAVVLLAVGGVMLVA